MNEVSNSEKAVPLSAMVSSWGNHLSKGVPWLIGVLLFLMFGGDLSEIISIKIDWTASG